MSELDEQGNLKLELDDEKKEVQPEGEQQGAEGSTPEPTPEPQPDDGFEFFKQKYEANKEKPQEEPKPVEPPKEEKPKGYDRVESDDPAVRDRINYLYKQTKIADSVNKELTEMNKILVQRLEALEKSKKEEERSSKIKSLENQIVEKQRMGQYAEVTNLQRELFSLENKKEEEKPLIEEIKETVKSTLPVEEQFLNAMTEDQHARMVKFLEEHPYTINDTIKGAVLRRGADYWKQNPDLPLRQIAEFIDKELVTWAEMHGVQPKNKPKEEPNINTRKEPIPSEVLTGDRATPATGKRVVELTPTEQNVAKKMFPDISPQEALRKYAQYKFMNESER